jgi:hypothetical protein
MTNLVSAIFVFDKKKTFSIFKMAIQFGHIKFKNKIGFHFKRAFTEEN